MKLFIRELCLYFIALICLAFPLCVFGIDDDEPPTSATETATMSTATMQEADQPKEMPIGGEDQKTAATTTTEVPPTPYEVSTSIYRLNGANDAACILISVDAIMLIKYTTMAGNEREVDRFVPNAVETSGDCSEQDDAKFFMKWKTYTLSWSFAKTPGGERWYSDKIELSFNTSDPVFEHIKKPDRFLRLSTPHTHTMLFPTPVGKAYTCPGETSIVLRGGSDVSATLLLRQLKIQPFIFKKDEFGPEYECSPGGIGAFRDETAPIAVGSTFAIVVLVTVTGYGVFRYIKIKKVQYDTME